MNAKPITRRSVLFGIGAFPISIILSKLGNKEHQTANMINILAQSDTLLGPPVAELSMRNFWGIDGDGVLNMVWSPDSGMIAAVTANSNSGFTNSNDIFIWSVKDQRLIGQVPQLISTHIYQALTFSPDGNVLVAHPTERSNHDYENAATLIDSHAAKVIGHIPAPRIPPRNWMLDTAITDPKGRWVALFFSRLAEESRGEFHLYDPIEWTEIRSWSLGEQVAKGPATIERPRTDYRGPVQTVTVDPEGTTIAAACNYTGENRFRKAHRLDNHTITIQQWDVETGQLKLEFNVTQPIIKSHDPGLSALAYSQDGSEILTGFTGTFGKRLLVWNASNGQYEREIPIQFPANSAAGVDALAVNPSIAIAAASFSDHRLRLFDFNSGAIITEIDLDRRFSCYGLRFSPDGKFLAYSDGATIFVRPINLI